MTAIDLVFRSVGERTAQLALDLAIQNINPQRVHIIENVRPFAKAVDQMLRLSYTCDYVVFVDADCLILEDMSPFLQSNTLPYVDCYVLDQFRGYQHCGVHITRIDVVRTMQSVAVTDLDIRYALRPESSIRHLAMTKLKEYKSFKYFKILHDFFQDYCDIFAKYALRQLRDGHKLYLNTQFQKNEAYWRNCGSNVDFQVARMAMNYIKETTSEIMSGPEMTQLIAKLPQIATYELGKRQISPQKKLDREQVIEFIHCHEHRWKPALNYKIFGIGLHTFGLQKVVKAFNILGFNLVQYPQTFSHQFQVMLNGSYDFSCLEHFDGIFAVAAAQSYKRLDQLYPNSRFVLTLSDKQVCLQKISDQWPRRGYFMQQSLSELTPDHLNQLSDFYDRHVQEVKTYFQNRPTDLLLLSLDHKLGWQELCNFLDVPVPARVCPL
ncbi:hypothetical protein IQ260_20545 [Leptolyngbya cf. ectocarpi LEGE 11479]|uniref:Uncharacterized protein n=1 Tax=Leptolyngbya cf. ectocarpi LEGE 11479 TaxID=1828722 RepID=A0A929FBX6_LEPEC|nr:sulfotransferase [Leptolyngbya ectocarpi]MBE9069038.1 hypothetical protein [Leptolyngbya cf. ectocarpi LEGE 11479]